MGILSTLGKVVSSAAKAYSTAQKNKNSSSSSNKSSSNKSYSGSSSSSSSSGYTPVGNNTDSYIKSSNASDYAAIQTAKQAYAEAQAKGDVNGMNNANAAANAIRAKYGYSGGSDGSQYIALKKEEVVEENPYEDAMADIQSKYDQIAQQQKEANALAVKQGTERLESQKDSINKSYDDSARQAYIASMQSKKNLPQQLAANGITGGATETANLKLQTNYENNLNDININRAKSINDIDTAINDLKNDGDLSSAEQALATSQAALTAYQNLLGSKIKYDETKKQNEFNSELSTIGQYSDDYQAEIDRRKANNPNDPLIPYLIAARQEKINAQEQNKNATFTQAVEQERELAWNLFQETGIADSYIEAVLGIPKGTTTLDYSKNQYDINKPYYKATTGSETSKSDVASYSTHKGIIENNYALKDNYGNINGYDIQAIKDYIEAQNTSVPKRLSDTDAMSLLSYYGISY